MDTPVTRKEFETLKDSIRDNRDALNQKMDTIIQRLNYLETQSFSPTFRRSGEEGRSHADLGELKPSHGEDMIVMEETLLKDGQGRIFLDH